MLTASDPNVTVTNVYFPQDRQIQVHASRVRPCPHGFLAGFYWYGGQRLGPGHPPRWVEQLLQSETDLDKPGEKSKENVKNSVKDVTNDLEPDNTSELNSDSEPDNDSEPHNNLESHNDMELNNNSEANDVESGDLSSDIADSDVDSHQDNRYSPGDNSRIAPRSTRRCLPRRYQSDYVCYLLGTSKI